MNKQSYLKRQAWFGVFALVCAALVVGCQDSAHPVGPELDSPVMAEDPGLSVGAKPNCDVDPTHPSCGDGDSGTLDPISLTGGMDGDFDVNTLIDNNNRFKAEGCPGGASDCSFAITMTNTYEAGIDACTGDDIPDLFEFLDDPAGPRIFLVDVNRKKFGQANNKHLVHAVQGSGTEQVLVTSGAFGNPTVTGTETNNVYDYTFTGGTVRLQDFSRGSIECPNLDEIRVIVTRQ